MNGAPVDSVLLSKFVIESAGAPRTIAAEAKVPDWAIATDHAMVASSCYLRTWELTEHHLDEPAVAFRLARQWVLGRFGLYDYLFSTASTLGEGLGVCGPYMGAISTNFQFSQVGESEQEVSFAVNLLNGAGRGRELAMQFALAAIFTRSRIVTGHDVSPVRVTFRQRAPRRHDEFRAVFGTDQIDFDAPADTVTVRSVDLTLALPGADPVLAGILRHHAASLPAPPSCPMTWIDQFRELLPALLNKGPVSLELAANRMATSPRTLQRRLADAGTTWRRELDLARQTQVLRAGTVAMPDLAHRLGYSDARTLRRAMRRWTAPG
jgi:AraC-like DNA-binding protein